MMEEVAMIESLKDLLVWISKDHDQTFQITLNIYKMSLGLEQQNHRESKLVL